VSFSSPSHHPLSRYTIPLASRKEKRLLTTFTKTAKRIFTDWKIYTGVIMYMGIVNTGYSGSFFVPTIIRELGYTSASAQIRSIPIALAFAFSGWW